MLTITGVTTFLVDGGFRPWTFVRIETSDGTVGWGDCTDWGSPRPVVAMVERLAELIIGRDPLAAEAIWWDLDAASVRHTGGIAFKAMSGIDSALWDIRGKVLNAPVWQLLGGKLRDELRLYWSHFGSVRAQHAARLGLAPVATTDDLRALAEEARRRGYTAVKTNLFPLADRPDADPGPGRATSSGELSGPVRRNAEAVVGTLREAFGPDIDIIVHGHCELDLPSAIRIAGAIEPIDPLYYEDPIAPGFSESWLALRRTTRLPLMTGENLELPEAALPFLQNAAVAALQPDLINSGGITGTKRIADLAALFHIPIHLHNVSGLVLAMASQQWTAAVFNAPLMECRRDTDAQAWAAASNAPVIREGKMRVSVLPGLGLDFDQDRLKAGRIDGEPWWGD